MTCDAAKQAIEARRFVGWRGLPPGCAPDVLFGIKLDDTWGVMPLGSSFEKARSHLVELTGYGRALAYVRDGAVAMFDAMAPSSMAAGQRCRPISVRPRPPSTGSSAPSRCQPVSWCMPSAA
jgi:hypothetical protein